MAPASGELERLVFPRQPRHDRICLADFYRPLRATATARLDVVAIQAVTAGDEVTELMASLEADGEFAEQLFVHGLGRRSAPRGWPSGCTRRCAIELGIGPAQGRRYSWGYPACPEQSEHEKVFRLLDAAIDRPAPVGGFAIEPEQSTRGDHRPPSQAVYFGMKSGFLPKTERQAADDLIAGSYRDPTLLTELSDADPDIALDGSTEPEGEPAALSS